jgi:hypothetical protein
MSKDDFKMPPLLNQSMLKETKIYYDREDYLSDKRLINNYLEIGVLAGDYSDLVIKHLKPTRVDLVDPYNQPDWNNSKIKRFLEETNYSYVKEKYSKFKEVNIYQEFFGKNMKNLAPEYDYIYIDADHSEDFMKNTLEFCSKRTSIGGVVGINDYMIFDHFNDEYYGIVQATNKFLLDNPNFKIHAYVLGAALHPDIYLKRVS